MASFKGYDRQEGQKRRQGQRKPRRHGIPRIEFLENRQLLTGGTTTPYPRRSGRRRTRNLLDAQNGPMANLGVDAVDVYKAYLDSGGNTSQLADRVPLDRVSERDGRAGRQEPGGRFQPVRDPAHRRRACRSRPQAQPTAWSMASSRSTSCRRSPSCPRPKPARFSTTRSYTAAEYQGEAYNEAETSMFADAARTAVQRRRHGRDDRRAFRQRQSIQRRPVGIVRDRRLERQQSR